MRRSLFKKVIAVVSSVTMIAGMANVVLAAHAANGENIGTQNWTSFSVCTREDGGVWEDALKAVPVYNKEDPTKIDRYQTKGQDYATEGYIAAGTTSSNLDFYVKNSGWDGQYDPKGNLVGDNPWGLTATMSNMAIEKGRTYTISFKISSTLVGKDDKGNVNNTKKHISFKAYKPTAKGDDPGVEFTSVSGASSEGYITLDSANSNATTVTATVKIPTKGYDSNVMGVKFAMGALITTYPEEIAMKGHIYVSDFKVTAGDQYAVKFVNGKTTSTSYVNKNERATAPKFTKKGYTLTGFKNASTGAMFNLNSGITSDMTLNAVWTKTKAPAKVKITAKSTSKKKVKVTFKKVKNAKGYQVQYSTNKKFKKAKAKTTTKKTYTIKAKSRSVLYIRAKAYTLDSTGKKVFSKKYSAKKTVYVK